MAHDCIQILNHGCSNAPWLFDKTSCLWEGERHILCVCVCLTHIKFESGIFLFSNLSSHPSIENFCSKVLEGLLPVIAWPCGFLLLDRLPWTACGSAQLGLIRDSCAHWAVVLKFSFLSFILQNRLLGRDAGLHFLSSNRRVNLRHTSVYVRVWVLWTVSSILLFADSFKTLEVLTLNRCN